MTQFEMTLVDRELKSACAVHGCGELSPANCRFCGFNSKEAELIKQYGLVRDPETGLLHLVPSKGVKHDTGER